MDALYFVCLTLTLNIYHVRMRFACRARSSMVEQWPFKPLVQGSNPCALTKDSPRGGFFVCHSLVKMIK